MNERDIEKLLERLDDRINKADAACQRLQAQTSEANSLYKSFSKFMKDVEVEIRKGVDGQIIETLTTAKKLKEYTIESVGKQINEATNLLMYGNAKGEGANIFDTLSTQADRWNDAINYILENNGVGPVITTNTSLLNLKKRDESKKEADD